jgi:hypothetical protein
VHKAALGLSLLAIDLAFGVVVGMAIKDLLDDLDDDAELQLGDYHAAPDEVA